MNRTINFILPRACLLLAVIACSIIPLHAQVKARITATAGQVSDFCGTTHVKVVFGCQGALYFVDFSVAAPQIQMLGIGSTPYLPVISQNGNWVTYQTGTDAEGPSSLIATAWLRPLTAGGVALKVADTAFVPRFVMNTPADTPEIIYATSVACPQSVCNATGKTLKRKIINNAPGAADVVFGGGSYYGGLSWDNKYLNTGWPGGPNVFMLDVQGAGTAMPVHTMRVKKNGTNIDTFVTVGACNCSRSASRIFTNTMLFYDFSSSAITAAKCFHPILGRWPEHELLFISRYDAEDLKVYKTPADRPLVPIADANGFGEAVAREWNNPEWSNHPYYAAASLIVDRLWNNAGTWDHTLNTERVYLVNLKDSVYLRLVESTDTSVSSAISFTNPFVWVEMPAGFQEDSTWLKQTIWERTGVINPYRPGGFLQRSTGSLPAEIVIYSVAGRKLATISSTLNSAVDLREKLRTLKAGTYLVVSKDREGLKHTSRWVNIK